MKRIVFALCAACISLGAMAQSKFAQRLQVNPKIDSLVQEVYDQGGHPDVTYYYDGKLHKAVNVSFMLRNDHQPTPLSGDPKIDATNQKLDSMRMEQTTRDNKMYDALRNTCLSLTRGATESYVWESHRGGMDSVRYAIAIGEYQSGSKFLSFKNQRDVYYYNAPELVSFHYNPFPDNDGDPWGPKGYGSFRYEYTPDSVFRPKKDIKPFNKEGYKQKILPILKQEGIASREFYVYHDSTYVIDDNPRRDFVYRDIFENLKLLKSETRGTIYTIHSRQQALSLLNQLNEATWAFLDENPYMNFEFHVLNSFRDRRLSEYFENLEYKRIPEFYRVYLNSYKDEFNIIIVEGTGNMMVPMEWPILKSWKNGKVTYDKKAAKALTPEDARLRSSSYTEVITHGLEPIDE